MPAKNAARRKGKPKKGNPENAARKKGKPKKGKPENAARKKRNPGKEKPRKGNRRKGKFIVVDGIDGSGKGTMIAMLRSHLLNQGTREDDIVVTAEPTGGKHGRKIRGLLRSGRNPAENAALFLDLYLKDRREHVRRVIRPALAKGKSVLCDRYKYSTIAYQSAQGLPREMLVSAHKKMPVPDIAIILDLPVAKGLLRVSGDASREGIDVFEQAPFLRKVRKEFLALKQSLPKERIAYVKASGKKEDVFAGILNAAGGVI